MNRVLFLIVCVLILGVSVAHAEMNRIETKRERMEREARSGFFSSNQAYAKIHEDFLRDDHRSVVSGVGDFLKRAPRDARAPKLQRLAELSQLKLNPPAISPTPTPALRQRALEEAPIFTVQVGAFARAHNAEALARRLKRLAYDAYVEPDEAGERHRVRVGHLGSRDEALVLESRLRKEGYPTKIHP